VRLITAVCTHDPAIRPNQHGPEWYCRECAWVLPLSCDDRCLRSVNAALRGLGAAATDTDSQVAARSVRARQSCGDGPP
jgi:hypothetical protein